MKYFLKKMFRKFGKALNTVHNLKVMICDEGQRLKNCGGTKTILALTFYYFLLFFLLLLRL
jgi:hypothetical protein